MTTTAEPTGAQPGDATTEAEEFEVLLLSCAEESGYAVFVPELPGCVSQVGKLLSRFPMEAALR